MARVPAGRCCSIRSPTSSAMARLDAPWGEFNVLDVAHPFAGAWARSRAGSTLPRAPLPGSMVSLAWRRRATAPCYGWPSLRARPRPGCSSSRADKAAISCRRSSAISKPIGSPARRRRFWPARPVDALHADALQYRTVTGTRRARSSAAPRRRSADARPRSRRRRWQPSSPGRSAPRRRRAAPTPSCRCFWNATRRGSVALLLVATSRPSAVSTMPSWPPTGSVTLTLRRAGGIRDRDLVDVLARDDEQVTAVVIDDAVQLRALRQIREAMHHRGLIIARHAIDRRRSSCP